MSEAETLALTVAEVTLLANHKTKGSLEAPDGGRRSSGHR